MGERKGVNKYYPPDYDPRKGGLNKFQGTHALRERARKLHMGILIIRFEMPYNIWCEGCENHIGMGVRYNAEKKKVGMYYSTPIYQFRMKCHLCDNHFEIKTDPANLDYEIVSGARRQERRWDPTQNEQVVPEDKAVTNRMAQDAMFKLEHMAQDKEKTKKLDCTLQELEEFQDTRWKEDYAVNRAMRDAMRVRRAKARIQKARDAGYNLPVPLLKANKDDEYTAKLLQFKQSKSSEELREEKRSHIDTQSVFSKLKANKISPASKKDYAKASIKTIVKNSRQNIGSFGIKPNAVNSISCFGSADLGIRQKITKSAKCETSKSIEKDDEKHPVSEEVSSPSNEKSASTSEELKDDNKDGEMAGTHENDGETPSTVLNSEDKSSQNSQGFCVSSVTEGSSSLKDSNVNDISSLSLLATYSDSSDSD
ncbi:coiled-coil domain-containing protein 130 homolog [Oratosquilla oratoria]|uniref:coiled-coil domain-containing protein 130 homolog n=1 Tax=Oratosquilla oratoria TaxID=337810 RepID=UPI003F76A88E